MSFYSFLVVTSSTLILFVQTRLIVTWFVLGKPRVLVMNTLGFLGGGGDFSLRRAEGCRTTDDSRRGALNGGLGTPSTTLCTTIIYILYLYLLVHILQTYSCT